MTAFDADEHRVELAVEAGEGDEAVDAAVGTLLLDCADRLRVDEVERPPLELVATIGSLGELAGALDLGRLADHLDILQTEAVLEPGAHDRDREIRDVDADPAPVELLSGDERGATAAERIEDDVAGAGRGFEDALEKTDGLLGRVIEAFVGPRNDVARGLIRPDVLGDCARHLVEVLLDADDPFGRVVELPFGFEALHVLQGVAPVAGVAIPLVEGPTPARRRGISRLPSPPVGTLVAVVRLDVLLVVGHEHPVPGGRV